MDTFEAADVAAPMASVLLLHRWLLDKILQPRWKARGRKAHTGVEGRAASHAILQKPAEKCGYWSSSCAQEFQADSCLVSPVMEILIITGTSRRMCVTQQ